MNRRLSVHLMVAMAVPWFASGCGSSLSAAKSYRDRGSHEIGALYYAAHYNQNSTDPSARDTLRAGIQEALNQLNAEFAARTEAGNQRGALAVAARKADILSYAASLGLEEFAAISAKPELDAAFPRARKEAVAAVDAVDAASDAGDGVVTSDAKLLALLREAMALDPNDQGLASRYERLRQGLSHTVTVRLNCEPVFAPDCASFSAEVLNRVTEENTELTSMAGDKSAKKDTELILSMSVRTNDSDWGSIKRGKADSRVARKNRFNEDERDKKGKTIYDVVHARYEVFERRTSAIVSVRVEVKDLGPSRKTLFVKSLVKEEQDTRTYIEWRGDQRALGKLAKHGTDRSRPTDPRLLGRKAADAAAAIIAKQLLNALENPTS